MDKIGGVMKFYEHKKERKKNYIAVDQQILVLWSELKMASTECTFSIPISLHEFIYGSLADILTSWLDHHVFRSSK